MINDLRYALRSLAKSPGMALAVVLCLGLGMGANTTIFSFTNALFLRPLAIREPHRLVRLSSGWDNERFRSASYPEYQALNAQRSAFAGVAAYRSARVSFGEGEATTMERALLISGNFWNVVGVVPAAGHFFTEAEDQPGASSVVILTDKFWRERFAGNLSIIGSTLNVSGKPYTVLGVARPDFLGIEADREVALYLPLMSYPHTLGADASILQEDSHWINLVGRLAPGVSRKQAQEAASLAAAEVVRAHPGKAPTTLLFTVLRGGTLVGTESSRGITMVFVLLNCVVGLVLLIACANVANILLARALSRRREIAIRLSLGAPRGRLIRQLLTESVLLGLAGGVVGLLFALWGTDLLHLLRLPAAIDATPDRRVIAYTFLIATGTGILFGLLPALHATRAGVADVFMRAARRGVAVRSKLRAGLVVSQIALSVVLLVVAGLLLRTVNQLATLSSGVFETGMIAAELDLTTLNLNEEQGRLVFDQVLRNVRSLPGVESATLSFMVPNFGRGSSTSVTLPETEQYRTQDVPLLSNVIGSEYFSTLGVPLLRGRMLNDTDTRGQPRVAVVNEAFARKYFADGNPVGKHMREANVREGTDGVTEIIGVVRDIRYFSPDAPAEPAMFVTYAQEYQPNLFLQVRTNGKPSDLIAPIRRELQNVRSGLAATYKTFAELRYESQFAPRMTSTLLTIFGALALLLAALGLYGVTAFVVALRTHEIGVRVALGALPAGVLRLITKEGLRLALLGLGIGLAFSIVAGKLVARAFFGVHSFDLAILAAVSVLMLMVALLASAVPARRAARIDPMITLKAE